MLRALVLLLAFQDAPAPPAVAPTVAVLDVDGAPVEKGKLPKSTDRAARGTWERLIAASGVAGVERAPVVAFDLRIDLLIRTNNESHDLRDARYDWLAPNYLFADTGNGRRQMRGPRGDWLTDLKSGEPPKSLDVGRENAEDRRQLDEALDVARLFASLVDPRSIRVQKFTRRDGAPAWLPAARSKDAQALAWYELVTPDVRPGSKTQASPGARMLLAFQKHDDGLLSGVKDEDSLVQMALVDDARAPEALTPASVFVDLGKWSAIDGYRVPHHIQVFTPLIKEAEGAGGATSHVADGWRPDPALDLYLRNGSSLKPALKPEDFVPSDLPKPSSGQSKSH